MSRLGRFGVTVATGTIVAIGLTGCSFLQRQPVPAAPTSEDPHAAACLVGNWHQISGWQHLTLDDGEILEIRLIEGGRDMTIEANGTGTAQYTKMAVWQGKAGFNDVKAEYAGTATLTYTAKDGIWKEVANNTKVTSTTIVDDRRGTPNQGSASRSTEWDYRCSSTDLIFSAENQWQLFKRA